VNITGLEVIRGNPGVAVANPGIAVGVIIGERIELTYGERLRVNTSFDYRGSAQKVTLYGAIGNRGLIEFNEKVAGEAEIDLPDSPEFTPCTASVDIGITSDIKPATDYDLYVKIKEYPGAGMPEVGNVITITGIPPTYELIQDHISHFAYIYDGDVEVTVATFKIDPFTPSAWAAKKFADALESEARKKGARVLGVKVYVDTTPLLWTDIRIEVTGTPLGEEIGAAAGRGIAVGMPLWLAIVLVCLAIIAVIVVATLMWERFQRTFKKKPGLEDVKPAWGKEALILDIQDAEEHWERTPTPVETLEGMSEEELRDQLDQIAEEEVPTGVSWVPLAILGGLGVLGVGGVAAYAMSKRKPKE